MKVPMFRDEKKYLNEAFDLGYHAGAGPFTGKCHTFLRERFRIGKALLTTSCTDALEMAALLVDAKPGDEFILPSYTFSSTATAFVLRGMKPVFVDIREDTLNIDEKLVERNVTKKTRAIVPIHYAGVPAEMDVINDIARRRGITVVEDAAQAVNSTYHGRYAGALADLGAFSFHATKAYSCGEGGALCMNREEYFQRSEFLWEKGTDRSLVIKGLKNKYHWVDVGSSFLLSDLLAAILLAQLENMDEIQKRREKLYRAYGESFMDLEEKGLRLPVIPPGIESNFHAFFLVFPKEEQRDRFLDLALERSVSPYIGYIPLHSSPFGTTLGGREYNLSVTDRIAKTVVRLPFYLMEDGEIEYACAVLRDCAERVL